MKARKLKNHWIAVRITTDEPVTREEVITMANKGLTRTGTLMAARRHGWVVGGCTKFADTRPWKAKY